MAYENLSRLNFKLASSPENEKRPETAAALNSGPALPGAPEEEKVDRSSAFIMHNYQRQLQDILHTWQKFLEPPLPPKKLPVWLQQSFPRSKQSNQHLLSTPTYSISLRVYYRFMPSNPNQLVELKVAGRYRMLPVWATKLSFEVRPGLKFDSRAWKLWKPCLLLLEEIVKKEKLKVSWVRIHSHFGLKGDIPHAMGWWDHEQKAMFLCHFDKETLLHEVGHALTSGYHGDPWAKATARLYKKYLKGKAYSASMIQLAHYLSGRRVYKALFGERPPKAPEINSIWKGLKPT